MTGNQWIRLSAALSLAAALACAKGEQSQTADSTARNLTLAPTESTAAMKDVPAPEEQPATPAPAPKPKPKPKPAPPPAPTSYTLRAGTGVAMSIDDSITTRHAKPGDTFRATVSEDIRYNSGHVVIPMGSVVTGTVVSAVPAPNPRSAGHLDLAVSTVAVRGRVYTVEGTVDSKDSVMGSWRHCCRRRQVGGRRGWRHRGQVVRQDAEGAVIGGVAGAAQAAWSPRGRATSMCCSLRARISM
jgi:hypothetical protein